MKVKTTTLRYYLKWILWVIVVQIVLANISAAIYAYKFTHLRKGPVPAYVPKNIITKTWKLFVGPNMYRNAIEEKPSFPYDSILLTTSDHTSVHAWYSWVDSSKGCVIFVHGYTGNKGALLKEAEEFRSWGYSVLLLDLRGHGESESSATTMGVKETDEVEKAFDYAVSKGNKKILLYGASLGAGICIKAAADGKIKPAAVIADMPFGSLHEHFKGRAREIGFPSEPFASLVTFWVGIEQGYNGFKHDVASYAKNVNCPVLVEWGDKDVIVSQHEIESVYQNLASKNKKLVIYPGAGHQSFLHYDPITWQKEMQELLHSLK